ncbi:hypothetical protein C8Q73DRAFT_85274 [Cubamyces lactineus]|nr:hypothetical protein C8Q73DRAFT_85274 [Cubamyces lactineus]
MAAESAAAGDRSLYGPLYGLPDPRLSQDLLSNTSTDAVREMLTKRRTTLQLEVLAVNALWNATLPINTLPVEILVHIFHLARPDESDDDDEASAPQVLFPLIPRVGSYHWIRFMLVCRHWRAVILSNYSLWRSVDIDMRMDPLEVALSRSTTGLVDVAIHGNSLVWDVHREFIETHCTRFRALHLSTYDPSPSFMQKFNQPLPALRELTLACGRNGAQFVLVNSNEDPDFDLSLKNFPSLVSVSLSGFALLSWESSILPKLRRLSLFHCGYRGPPLSYSRFLDVLEGMQSLEELRLHGFLSAVCPDAGVIPDRVVSLPKLGFLAVGDIPPLPSPLLRNIRHPQRVQAAGFLTLEPEVSTLESISFSFLLPPDPALWPLLSTAEIAEIDASKQVLQIIGRKGVAFLAFDLCIDGSFFYDDFTAHAMLGLSSNFRDAPLREVYIMGSFDDVNDRDYTNLLWALPNLELLCIDANNGAVQTLFLALGEEHRDNSGAGVQVICPKLKTLDIEGLWWEEITDPMRTIRHTLGRRASRGVYLQRLVLDLRYNGPVMSQDCRVIKAKHFNKLCELVPGGDVVMSRTTAN